MTTELNDIYYMQLALEQAALARDNGEVPVGAIVVHHPIDNATRKPLADPKVIASAYNLRETLKDASAHAEFLAMQAAMVNLDNWRLQDCTIYVTLEPCIMCAGLMQQARISRCVFGAYDPKGGALGTLYNIQNDARLNHNFEVTGGILEDECSLLLKKFFKLKRK